MINSYSFNILLFIHLNIIALSNRVTQSNANADGSSESKVVPRCLSFEFVSRSQINLTAAAKVKRVIAGAVKAPEVEPMRPTHIRSDPLSTVTLSCYFCLDEFWISMFLFLKSLRFVAFVLQYHLLGNTNCNLLLSFGTLSYLLDDKGNPNKVPRPIIKMFIKSGFIILTNNLLVYRKLLRKECIYYWILIILVNTYVLKNTKSIIPESQIG